MFLRLDAPLSRGMTARCYADKGVGLQKFAAILGLGTGAADPFGRSNMPPGRLSKNVSTSDVFTTSAYLAFMSQRLMAILVPKNPEGFCFNTTISCGDGAISATISLPSTLVAGLLPMSSSERPFFQLQLPLSQLSSRRTPVV